jgi:hypothetical protein
MQDPYQQEFAISCIQISIQEMPVSRFLFYDHSWYPSLFTGILWRNLVVYPRSETFVYKVP